MLDLARNSFVRLPPALATATSLRELSLAQCCQLVFSAVDFRSTLLCLPRLRQLYLEFDGVPEGEGFLIEPQLRVSRRIGFMEWQGPE